MVLEVGDYYHLGSGVIAILRLASTSTNGQNVARYEVEKFETDGMIEDLSEQQSKRSMDEQARWYKIPGDIVFDGMNNRVYRKTGKTGTMEVTETDIETKWTRIGNPTKGKGGRRSRRARKSRKSRRNRRRGSRRR